MCTRHAFMANSRNLQSLQQSERRNYANRPHLHYAKSSRRINAAFSFTLPLSPIRVCSGTHCAHYGLSLAIGGHFWPRLRCSSIYLVSIKTYFDNNLLKNPVCRTLFAVLGSAATAHANHTSFARPLHNRGNPPGFSSCGHMPYAVSLYPIMHVSLITLGQRTPLITLAMVHLPYILSTFNHHRIRI